MSRALFVFLALSLSAAASQLGESAGVLNLRLMVSGGEQRQVYQELIDRFRKEHPGIAVRHREFEQEDYKANIEAWLSQPDGAPDVMFYFAGHLMADFYRKGLVRPIGDLWQSQQWNQAFPPAISEIVRYRGKPMGLPIAYYHWGIYYRKSLFQRLGIDPPETWDELLAVGEALKAEGITPFALGSEARWPAAAWFDYLNLRTNGLEFHRDLLAGKAAFDDERVRRVLSLWGDLVDREFFLPGHSQMSWRSALPYLYQNHAGMMLMGGFVVPQFPQQLIDDIGLFPFPVIDPERRLAEEAPTDLLFIPSRARNVTEAEAFLRFVARPDIQGWFNRRMGTIAPNRQSPDPEDRLVAEGQTILKRASGYSQFFDREMVRSVSSPAMDAFVDFLERELSVEALLATLATIRQNPEQ
ncbi:ABC transporter substrate-binding protein [Marinobacter confluentis]|uniref:ABC transporter substrate-binding protein n=1 Tax=Marinobacter confluentis TaxID=1697557 RepID=UPI00143DA4E8|nr:ABC transporter substrate-binding protein [Marinobacter confluentis]